MKILIANDGFHAHYFERMAWANAFNSDQQNTAAMYNVQSSRAFDIFDSFEPDIFIGQLYNLDSATIKCITSRPNLKVALRAGEWNDGERDPNVLFVTQKEINNLKILLNTTGKPDFIFSYYQQKDIEQTHANFEKLGVKVVGVPMSADVHVYANGNFNPALECEIGFVGGYWPYKGQIIDQYLTPLCYDKDHYHIKIFGNQPWPHVNQYCGTISDNHVADLFKSADICPNLSEPHAHTRGIDVNERAFKILCAGGFCIMDNVRAAREMIPEGIVFAESPAKFRELVDYYLSHPNERHEIAEVGKKYVLQNHTNFHRAILMLETLSETAAAERLRAAYRDYVNYIQQRQTATT
jgi:spore maturation protein CgeB